MSTDYADSYELGDAPVLGEGTVTIENATFGYDAQYRNGEAEILILEGKVVDDEGQAHDWRKFYPVGTGWSVNDGGRSISRQDGKGKIMRGCKYGLWLQGALESGAGEELRKRGPATEAKVWDGMKFEVRSKESSFKNSAGEMVSYGTLVPVAYLGAGAQSAGSPTTGPAVKSGSAAAANAGLTAADLPVKLRRELKKVAAASDTYDAWVDAAFLVDGVDGNPGIESMVADSEDLYLELRG